MQFAENYNSLEWTTSGDGAFDDNTVLNPIYTPGPTDIENGNTLLTLTCCWSGSMWNSS